MNVHGKQISALKTAIECMENERRRSAPEGNLFRALRLSTVDMDTDGITGTLNAGLAAAAHKIKSLDDDIQELEDLIEILESYDDLHNMPGTSNTHNVPNDGGKPGRKRKRAGANVRQLRLDSI